MNKRFYNLDLVSTFFIFLVISAHTLQLFNMLHTYKLISQLYYVLFFVLLWFYFKSGMFFNKDTSIKQLISTEAKKLLIPFIIFTIIGFIVDFPFYFLNYNYPLNAHSFLLIFYSQLKLLFWEGSVSGNQALWFLLSLFFVKVIFIFLYKYNLLFLIVAFLLFGWYLVTNNLKLPLSTGTSVIGIIFYTSGYLFTKYNMNNKKSVICLSIIVFLISILFFPSLMDLRISRISYGNYFIWVISSIAGIIITYNLSLLFKPRKYIYKISRYSMNIYAYHWIILYFCFKVSELNKIRINGSIILIILFVILPISLFLMSLITNMINPKRIVAADMVTAEN